MVVLNGDEVTLLRTMVDSGIAQIDAHLESGDAPSHALLILERALLRSLSRHLLRPNGDRDGDDALSAELAVLMEVVDRAAHRLAGLTVAASVASEVAERDPDTSLALVRLIEEESREALEELRRAQARQ